ncbi:hypothetical protein ATCC90586_000507 [Pythium insidiosum]|nr:hypothetical protein ATCC90586_000507 [Pythium insidiosum]
MTKRDSLDDAEISSPSKIARKSMEEADVSTQQERHNHAARAAASAVTVLDEISLTPQEEKLFEFLLDVEKQYDCKAVLRVAGGWVRDKLLGRHSDDVDIVLDTMTGKEFADLINAYETDHGHKQHPVGIIKANPDQSKHLETATMQLGDIGWVDFVNLRAETYSDEHRIPEVEFGTPLQDAERRDFTINSLFFNISERRIEDLTQRGISDLKNGVIRTPLEPRVTFLDDPLRVLRAIRFASRFNFAMDEALQDAAKSDDVKAPLIKKVSRERVGKELLGMLTGTSAHPERAIRMIHDMGLCQAIFLPPQEEPIYRRDGTPMGNHAMDDEIWDRGYAYTAAMYELVSERSSSGVIDVSSLSETEQNAFKLRIMAAFLLPLADHYVVLKKRQQLLPFVIIRDSLKGNDLIKGLGVKPGPAVKETIDQVIVWQLENPIVSQGLIGVWNMKPLLNGNDLIKGLGVKPGPAVKETIDQVIVWQLENPSASREECLAHFQALKTA